MCKFQLKHNLKFSCKLKFQILSIFLHPAMIATVVLLFFGIQIIPALLYFCVKIVYKGCKPKPDLERRVSVGSRENDIEMWNLRIQSKCQDPRFDRRSFRTFGQKFKPLPEPPVSYSVLSGGVHIGFPSSSPPPPPQPFAQIGNKKTRKNQKTKAPQPPLPPTIFVETEKPKKQAPISPVKSRVSPVRKAPPPPRNHPSIIKRGSTIWVAAPGIKNRRHPSKVKGGSTVRAALSATQNPDGFVTQQLTPFHQSQLI